MVEDPFLTVFLSFCSLSIGSLNFAVFFQTCFLSLGVSQLHLKEQRPSWTFRHDEETSAGGWLHHSGGTARPSF